MAIEGISDLNVVTNLFSQVGCVEADNCILVMTNRDFGAIDSAGDMMTSNATRVGAINESIKEQVGEFHKNLDYKKDRM